MYTDISRFWEGDTSSQRMFENAITETEERKAKRRGSKNIQAKQKRYNRTGNDDLMEIYNG